MKAAEMLGEKPENCLVVEDALAGIDAAYAGDFRVLESEMPQVIAK